jgi:hypothetical protein
MKTLNVAADSATRRFFERTLRYAIARHALAEVGEA